MKDCGDKPRPLITMKAAQSLGRRRRSSVGEPLRRLTLDVSVILSLLTSLASVASQDSDCTWKPQSEVEEGVTALECDLKTLQTGPASIPQVKGRV